MIKRKTNTIHLIIIFSLFINLTYFAQVKSNLEVIKGLVDSSVNYIAENIKTNNNKEFEVKFVAPDDYSILQMELISGLQKHGFIVYNKNESKNANLRTLTYALENTKVDYKNIFKDGIIGTYLVEREAKLKGSYFIEDKNKLGKVKEFNYTLLDTVFYDDIKSLDNIAYQFTSAELPDEPFFSSLLEPTIAIGTAAIAVYLFFNIRSK